MRYNRIITETSKYLIALSTDRISVKIFHNPTTLFFNIFFLLKSEVIPISINNWDAELSPYGEDVFFSS